MFNARILILFLYQVVLTDYPDASLIENMQYNVDQNIQQPEIRSNVHVEV